MNLGALIVIAKEPVPGRVKTRLQSRFTAEQAARLAAASLADTLDVALAATAARAAGAGGVPGKVYVALEGAPGEWLPAGVEVFAQSGGSLDLRLGAAFARVFASGHDRLSEPVLLVGMDTPQLTAQHLTADWNGADAALGLSSDGGFWAIGLRKPCPEVFPGIPMSTDRTGAAQLARLRSLGLRVHLLPELRDVDTPQDALAVAALAPKTRFARLHREFEAVLAPIPMISAALETQVGPAISATPNGPVPSVARMTPLAAPKPVTPAIPAARAPREHPLDLYAAALSGERVSVELAGGRRIALDVERWSGPPDEVDMMMLNRCEGTVLDLGCGPGRLVAALAETGTPALGIDISDVAVQLTARRGACVLRRDLNGPLPGEGRWGTVLLADGNLGIGGDPRELMIRCARLLRPGGLLLIEADRDDDIDECAPVTLVDSAGRRARPLAWARMGRVAVADLAGRTGFLVVEEWRADGRVFLALRLTSEALAMTGATV